MIVGFFVLASILAACGNAERQAAAGASNDAQAGWVDTDKYDLFDRECEMLTTEQMGEAIGQTIIGDSFTGPICRWSATGDVWVTFNWFEWNTMAREKDVARRLGYTTETRKINSATVFTQRDPQRPGTCGVTAKASGRGIYTWFVNQPVAVGDPCDAPLKLMELVLKASA
ncbi:DUF3558 domain-containing protein [Gordonia sp. CPCC 205333]|uniref:DUF3558 domain-containing protein n=1 Tax=Gordonia sp. CPCC 205333 TaxID=3140790 RepID=UPI003AF37F9E